MPTGSAHTLKRRITHTFLDTATMTSSGTTTGSGTYDCSEFNKFNLYVHLTKTEYPTGSVQVKVQFAQSGSTATFFDYQNGPFGYMLWNEAAIPTAGLFAATKGECIGTSMKVSLIGTSGSSQYDTIGSTHYFTGNIFADFKK